MYLTELHTAISADILLALNPKQAVIRVTATAMWSVGWQSH
ncbi:hypothetical protein [Nostoc sphaeroides]|nr:hypothetical protein [Nostoc sphaeroides]